MDASAPTRTDAMKVGPLWPGQASWTATALALSAFLSAWIGGGSMGLLSHGLRVTVATALLTLAVVNLCAKRSSSLPPRPRSNRDLRLIAILTALLLPPLAWRITGMLPAMTLATAIVVAMCASSQATATDRRLLALASSAMAMFGLFQFSRITIPSAWLACDTACMTASAFVARIMNVQLLTGAQYGGLDFLLLTVIVICMLTVSQQPRRWLSAAAGIFFALVAHCAYLYTLAQAPVWLAALPATGPAPAPPILTPPFSWADAVRSLIPWNMTAIGAAFHLIVIGTVIRWTPIVTAGDGVGNPARTLTRMPASRARTWVGIAAAIMFAYTVTYSSGISDLAGKSIVFFEKGYLNWDRPQHGLYGRLGGGMYGMLPSFAASLGASVSRSENLSDADLQNADALLLIFPDEPWPPEQLARIRGFVERGGSLLLLAEHTAMDEAGRQHFDDVLRGTGMRIPFDTAEFAVGGWLESYEAMAHTLTAGVGDHRNEFGPVIGSSVVVRHPARPILIGKHGFIDNGDRGSDSAMLGNQKYDAGEKLGDVVLAAEQDVGRGRILVFGDTSGLNNQINVSTHEFNARLFAWLCNGGSNPQTGWRQALGAVLGIGLMWLLATGGAARAACVSLALLLAAAASIQTSAASASPVPDGGKVTATRPSADPARKRLMYVDATHLTSASEESWRDTGTMGAAMAFMREGYLALTLANWSWERLSRAGVLLSIAPNRPFTTSEIDDLERWVRDGGVLISTVGYDRFEPSREMLARFGLYVGDRMPTRHEPLSAPEPLGHYKAPFLDAGTHRCHVRFHAAWPVGCDSPDHHVMAYGRADVATIIKRRLGNGAVILVGDTCFAMNLNLEFEDGRLIEGARENADFWRWLITGLHGESWIPPKPENP